MSDRPLAGIPALLLALAVGPGGWIAQLGVDYGLSSYACFPHGEALRQLNGWASERAVLVGVNLICLLVVAAGFAVAFTAWRRLGSTAGRSRFLALCGTLSGAGFLAAILFDTVVVVATPTCWSFR